MALIIALILVAFVVVSFILVNRDKGSKENNVKTEPKPLFRVTALGFGNCDLFSFSDGKYHARYNNETALFAAVSTNQIEGKMSAVSDGRKVENERMVEFRFICGTYNKSCDATITNDVRQTIYTKSMADNSVVYMTSPILITEWGEKTYVLTLKYRVSDDSGAFGDWHTADDVIVHKMK